MKLVVVADNESKLKQQILMLIYALGCADIMDVYTFLSNLLG